MRKTVYNITCDADQAEDLTNDTFIRLIEKNSLIRTLESCSLDGYTLDPNFKVYYPSNDSKAVNENVVSPMSTDLFNGTKDLPLNTNGNQGVYLCSDFTVSASEPDVWCKYSSGIPSGVNFAVLNITRNTAVGWIPNLQPGSSDTSSWHLVFGWT